MSYGDILKAGKTLAFGQFRLNAAERLLERDGRPVALGSRALDILIALVERSGDVVSRRELIERAWPDLVVEEANLRVHISSLRKVLGDGQDGSRYVTNVPGRGYCFVAPVQCDEAAQPSPAPVEVAMPATLHRLPIRRARMVGREETVAELSALIGSRRFVSVIGTGGMGKTTVAISVAHALLDDFGNAAYFVDLGALTNAALVPAAVASAVGFMSLSQDPLPSLLAFLSGLRILLVLDNCEHVIDAAAILTERIYCEAPQVHMLTTSRESLRVEGEYVHLLRPLDNPPEGQELTAGQALKSPAVQLFMERAAASGHRFDLTDDDAPVVAGICRRLDGIALAIELAAGRVGAYGIRGTADLLDNRFKLLWQGRRSALPRHQTLHAMLDWSYNLLSERDRRVLCRLSVFVGIFTLAAAQAVAADTQCSALDAADAIAGLIDKSLIWVSSIGGVTFHRLLDTMRAFAATKLAETSEGTPVSRRHALYYSERLRVEAINASGYGGRDLSACALHLGNIRAALEWSFSSGGDPAIGVELAARSAALFLGLSLLGECPRWCEQGLAALDESNRGSTSELVLQQALAASAMFTRGNNDEVRVALERGLHLAETLGEQQHHLHLLAGLHMFLIRTGDFPEALVVAQRSAEVAREIGDPRAMIIADWMLGCSHYHVGGLESAQHHFERGLESAAASGLLHLDVFGFDHRNRALLVLSHTLWLRGFPDRAARTARQAIKSAKKRDRPIDVCVALARATTPIASLDFAEAEELCERLVVHAAKYQFRPYHAIGLALKGQLAIARCQAGTGVELLRNALAILNAERQLYQNVMFWRALAEGLVQRGEVEEAAATINAALEWAKQRGNTCDMPDLLRVRAEIFLAAPHPDRLAAEKAFLEALECARSQTSLSLELRTAIALARLWIEEKRGDEARELLARIYQRFTEGFATSDLKSAVALLEQLRTQTSKSA